MCVRVCVRKSEGERDRGKLEIGVYVQVCVYVYGQHMCLHRTGKTDSFKSQQRSD